MAPTINRAAAADRWGHGLRKAGFNSGRLLVVFSSFLVLRLPLLKRPWLVAPLLVTPLLVTLLVACVPAHRRPSWVIFPLQRRVANDGLAVVSQPDGYGLHIWVDTDTSTAGVCRPRWTVDPARLFNGNGTAPFSSGLAGRDEFFMAVARADVRRALRRQSEALCRERAPRSSFSWLEPPRRAGEVKPQPLPPLEGEALLGDPNEVERRENELLNP